MSDPRGTEARRGPQITPGLSPEREFLPGTTEIRPSGAVLDEADRTAVEEAALGMRIAAGPERPRYGRNGVGGLPDLGSETGDS